MSKPKLKPCPFCEESDPVLSRDQFKAGGKWWTNRYWVECAWCGGRTASASVKEIAKRDWNRIARAEEE